VHLIFNEHLPFRFQTPVFIDAKRFLDVFSCRLVQARPVGVPLHSVTGEPRVCISEHSSGLFKPVVVSSDHHQARSHLNAPVHTPHRRQRFRGANAGRLDITVHKQRIADLDQGNSHLRRLIQGAKHLHGSPADRDGLVHISSQQRPLGQVEECPGGGATRTGLFGQCKCDSRSLPRQREIATEDANLRGTQCAEVSADKRCARANERS
jgi:hypothetical protein